MKKKKEWIKAIKTICKCKTLQQIVVPYGSILHISPTSLLLLAARQEPYKKAYFLTENTEEFSGKSSGEWASRQGKKR